MPSFSPFAEVRGLSKSRRGLLWRLSHCWPNLAVVPNCVVFLAIIQYLKPNLFPNRNKIKDLHRNYAYYLKYLTFGRASEHQDCFFWFQPAKHVLFNCITFFFLFNWGYLSECPIIQSSLIFHCVYGPIRGFRFSFSFFFFPQEVFCFVLIFGLYTIPARVVCEVGCNVSFTPVSPEPWY